MKILTDSTSISYLNSWTESLVEKIKKEMESQGINASGNLSNSLEYTISDMNNNGTHIVVLADNYFTYAVNGRPKGFVPTNFTDILKKWIKDKGLSVNDKEDAKFAFFISRKIKNYGSRRHRENDAVDVISPALEEMRPQLEQILENGLIAYVNDELFNRIYK